MITIPNRRGFASDNNAGVHPSVMENLIRVNQGHLIGYGHDDYTHQVASMIAEYLGAKAVHFLYSGTAANVLCIQHCLRSYEAVICPSSAHIDVDECGAPEHYSGNKLLIINKANGKITPEDLSPYVCYKGLEYRVQPKLVSISNPNELGLVYTPNELQAISDCCKSNGWYFHVDGARISNACAYLDVSFKNITADVGVDILSLGGTKNGLMGAEAVVIFNPNIANDFVFTQKQGMQLASKMRYIAAQFEAYFRDELWLRNACHANHLAQRLGKALEKYSQIKLVHPVESNAVFARLPKAWIESLLAHFFFYVWDEEENIVRWVCSWDSQEEDVERLISLLDQLYNL
jgi:threonine aldolase